MRRHIPLILGALLLACAPVHAAHDRDAKASAELARAIEGRVAGEPVDCLNLRDIRSSRIIDRTAIIYETSGGRLYVNRPESGQRSLDKWDVQVTDTHSSQLCSVDVVYLYDTGSRMRTGFVGLGKFVPYTKPKTKD